MGRSVTSQNRVEVIDRSGYRWAMVFPFKGTYQNLTTFIEHFNNSILQGVNQHLGHSSLIVEAKVVSQKGKNKGQTLTHIIAHPWG